MGRRSVIAVAAGSLAAVAWGCGGGFAPAAEPEESPPLAERPAGMTFPVGDHPEGLVVDPSTGLAATIVRNPSRLAIADLARRRIVRTATLRAAGRHLALARGGGTVLVPATKPDELIEVGIRSGSERAIPAGHHPHDVATAAGRIFVGDESADAVAVVARDRRVGSLPTPQQPGGLAGAGKELAVVAVAARVLAVYDARRLTQLGEVPAGEGPTHVVAAGQRAWVADTDGGAILAFRLGRRPGRIGAAAAPGAPYGIALDRRRRRLWVTLTARNEVVGFDVSGRRPRELARYHTVRQPNSVAVDPRDGAVVVVGRDAGRLEVIVPRRR